MSEKWKLSNCIQSTVFPLKLYFIYEFYIQSELRKEGKAKYIIMMLFKLNSHGSGLFKLASYERKPLFWKVICRRLNLRSSPPLKGKLVNHRSEHWKNPSMGSECRELTCGCLTSDLQRDWAGIHRQAREIVQKFRKVKGVRS